ncbi:hypothetical protein B0H12DRAFT_135070 [Mycena haematopus]|nr:hypothetical protein B0H12DRAFT_135070 [Mycena haematopus]
MRHTILSCGAEDPLGDIYQDANPFQPQILPVPLDPPSQPSKKRKRSNGCGTILHSVAIVSPTNTWRAVEMWNDLIIPLDDKYFPTAVAKLLSLGWKPCGCVRSGVGCAVCGNPLGSLFTPCARHQDSESGTNYYTILPSAVSPPIPPYTPPSPRRIPFPPRAERPLPLMFPPRSRTRHRHPTSPPPPLIMYADFTPTPSPEVVSAALPVPESEPEPRSASELRHGWETVNMVGEDEDNENENDHDQNDDNDNPPSIHPDAHRSES